MDSSAQVITKLQLPPVGLSLKSQLWNLSLINTSNEVLDVRLELVVSNASTNQKILSGTTRVINLPKGLRMLTANGVAPVTYNVLSPEYNFNVAQEGFIPVGTYNVCYTLVAFRGDAGGDRIGEECETIDVQPISPPLLISPSDSEYVEINRPLFTWLPPSPSNLFNGLAYDFTLAEVQSTQSGADAIQQNIPIQQASNLLTNSLQYSPSFQELDTAKLYAWQITVKSAGSPVAQSEVWTFRLKSNKSTPIKNTDFDYYAKLKMGTDASFSLSSGVVKYAYLNEANDKSVAIKVHDITSALRKEIKLDSSYVNLQYGENYRQLDLSQSGLADKHVYLLELINSKRESWYLKFEYRKQD